jgi:hypothetical protein
MKFLITYEQLRLLERGVEFLERDLTSTHFRLVTVKGTTEQYDLIRRQREELTAALSALRKAVWSQFPGDPEKTGWALHPVGR